MRRSFPKRQTRRLKLLGMWSPWIAIARCPAVWSFIFLFFLSDSFNAAFDIKLEPDGEDFTHRYHCNIGQVSNKPGYITFAKTGAPNSRPRIGDFKQRCISRLLTYVSLSVTCSLVKTFFYLVIVFLAQQKLLWISFRVASWATRLNLHDSSAGAWRCFWDWRVTVNRKSKASCEAAQRGEDFISEG